MLVQDGHRIAPVQVWTPTRPLPDTSSDCRTEWDWMRRAPTGAPYTTQGLVTGTHPDAGSYLHDLARGG